MHEVILFLFFTFHFPVDNIVCTFSRISLSSVSLFFWTFFKTWIRSTLKQGKKIVEGSYTICYYFVLFFALVGTFSTWSIFVIYTWTVNYHWILQLLKVYTLMGTEKPFLSTIKHIIRNNLRTKKKARNNWLC